MSRSGLGRRSLLAYGGIAIAGGAKAAEEGHHRFTIGQTVFTVPDSYLFGEILPPGVTTDGLPPHFSFAFTMPDGAPAGNGLQFPPVTAPFELEREGGRYLVMCYRVAAGGHDGLNVSPGKALINNLISTESLDYGKVDGMLDLKLSKKAGILQRYYSKISDRDQLGISAFVSRLGDSQFFYGYAELEKPNVVTVLYMPQERVASLPKCLNKFAELLVDWSKR